MATIKLILWKYHKKKDGTRPIVLRIIQDRKPKYVFTGEYVLEKDWSEKESKVKKSHPNSTRLNNVLIKKLSEAHATILELEAKEAHHSAKQIQKHVRHRKIAVSFFPVAAERIKNKYEAGTFSVAKSELSILYNITEFLNYKRSAPKAQIVEEIKNRRKERVSLARKGKFSTYDALNEFSKKKTLAFEDIDVAFIKRYKTFCSAYLGQSTRTISNQLIFIRTLFNQVITNGDVSEKFYPFAGDKEKIKITSSNKIGLNAEEIKLIEELELEPHTSIWHAKNVWLFAFYFAGLRISDALELKWSDFVDWRLYYTMNKNEKPVSLQIPEKALSIVKLYEGEKSSQDDYIFPFLKKANPNDPKDIFTKTRNATSLFNKYLKRIAAKCGIEKNLSNHIARHSFGNLAGDKIHPLMLQKLYRHSNLKTTINYQANFIHKDADDALGEVLNY